LIIKEVSNTNITIEIWLIGQDLIILINGILNPGKPKERKVAKASNVFDSDLFLII
jgi:hypothetical protein